jgi:hypothetical protein
VQIEAQSSGLAGLKTQLGIIEARVKEVMEMQRIEEVVVLKRQSET